MDVKPAVNTAKLFVSEIFRDEGLKNIGLEEVEFDSASNEWIVTIGFSRPWDEPPSNALMNALGNVTRVRRDYKIVRLSASTGEIRSVKNREPASEAA